MSAPNGGPAFPYAFHFPEKDGEPSGINFGMTLRDWFAGQMLSPIATSAASQRVKLSPDEVANEAYRYADAMLAARARKEPTS